MPDINLNSNDYIAITRALDKNNNNRIDNSEAQIGQRANMMIGNANNVSGTREVASSLERGDIVLTGMDQESANKIADYFSDRAANEGLPVAKWKGDGWVSKADLGMSDRARKLIDLNGDNRISSREFADALRSGKVTIGNNGVNEAASPTTNPFQNSKPAGNTNSSDPFGSKPVNTPSKPGNTNDPFSGGNQGASKPINSNDPFSSGSGNTQSGKPPVTSNPFGSSAPAKPSSNNDPFSSGTNSAKPPVTSNPFGSSTPAPSANKPANGDPFSRR